VYQSIGPKVNGQQNLTGVAIKKPEQHVCKALHCGSKQQEFTLLLLLRATYIWCCSSRTFRSRWTAHSLQCQQRGCNAGFIELFYQYLVLVDDFCGHASYQHCVKVLSTWNKLPYTSEKS